MVSKSVATICERASVWISFEVWPIVSSSVIATMYSSAILDAVLFTLERLKRASILETMETAPNSRTGINISNRILLLFFMIQPSYP